MIVYVYVYEYLSLATLYDFSPRKVFVKMLQREKWLDRVLYSYYCLLNTVWVLYDPVFHFRGCQGMVELCWKSDLELFYLGGIPLGCARVLV